MLRVIIERIIEELLQYMSCKLLTMLGLLTSRTVRPTTKSRFYLIVDERCVTWRVYFQSHPALWSDFFVTGPDAFRMRQQTAYSVMAAMADCLIVSLPPPLANSLCQDTLHDTHSQCRSSEANGSLRLRQRHPIYRTWLRSQMK